MVSPVRGGLDCNGEEDSKQKCEEYQSTCKLYFNLATLVFWKK